MNRPAFIEMLEAAVRGGYAIPAFNVYHLESFTAAIRAGEQTTAPIIVALGEAYFSNLRPAVARALFGALFRDAPGSVVGLHLDHAQNPESCFEAIAAGFSSVMIDASHLPYEENVRLTRRIVTAAHEQGVGVEAELGGIAVGTASHEFSSGEEVLTDPEQALDFVRETGVDALAVSVGTVHGLYRGEPKIDLQRLSAIQAAVDIPLVLHGGSGTPAPLLDAAIARGVAKVNVNTEISLKAVQEVAHSIAENAKVHQAQLALRATKVMEDVMTDYIQRFHAIGKRRGS